MGNKDSTKIKQEISNKINTEIENITSNINKVLNDTSTSTVSNIVSENASQIKQSTAASNKMDLGEIDISGDSDIDISQKADIEATSKAIINIISSTEQMAKMANQMAQDMANKLQNDNAMQAALTAASKLKESEKDAGGPEAMVNKVMESVSKMMSAGNSSSKDIETSIRNEMNMKITNKTTNENEIKNLVKNHVENNITKVNKQSCDIQVSGDNVLVFKKLKASGNAKLKISQSVLINAFNDCIVTAMDTQKLTSDITGLQTTKTSADTANANKQGADMKAETEVTKESEKKSAIMESVDNLVTTAGEVGKSAIAGGTMIMIVGLIAVAGIAVFFLQSPEAMAMAGDAAKNMKKGGGLNNPYTMLIILGLLILFNQKS